MAGWSIPAPRAWLALGTCLVALAALVVATRMPPPAAHGPAAGGSSVPVRVLQMNLCNSGLAGCYTGRSVPQAATVIRAVAPDLVTVNEVCRTDLPALRDALAGSADATEPTVVTWAFQPALDRRTGGPYRCRNGQPYGIGLLARRPPGSPAPAPTGGTYPTQDTRDPEERVWVCLADARFLGCTTHLADTSRTVARAQCSYLLDTTVATARAHDPGVPVIVGGDLNLSSGSSGLRACLPATDRRADDGGVQEVVATPQFTVTSHRSIDMQATTDHPGLLVTLALAGT